MRKLLWIALLLVIGLGWWGRSWLWPEVEVVHPTRGPAVQAVYATGTVEATVMLPIAPRVGARLVELSVDEGEQVEKGQVLARLEDEDVQNALKQLQAREALARKTLERYSALVKRDNLSKQAYDQARSDYDAAKAAVAKGQAEANYMKLLAPADGRILKRDGEVGQVISPNQAVFWLSCCAPLRITAEVDEEDIPSVTPGQKVLIRADAFPGKIFHGAVQAITPMGDPVSRSYRVRIAFTEKTPLQIGMTAETNIILSERQNALLVPTSAISQERVWLVRDGRLVKQAVTAGARGAEKVEILSGIAEQDLVVRAPDATMQDGQNVQPRLLP